MEYGYTQVGRKIRLHGQAMKKGFEIQLPLIARFKR
jgi:hypothetical protein